jgi:hypothetical protein
VSRLTARDELAVHLITASTEQLERDARAAAKDGDAHLNLAIEIELAYREGE